MSADQLALDEAWMSSSSPATQAGSARPLLENLLQPVADAGDGGRVEGAGAFQRGGPRQAAGDVVFEQAAVEGERHPEVERRRIGRGVEPSRPQVPAHASATVAMAQDARACADRSVPTDCTVTPDRGPRCALQPARPQPPSNCWTSSRAALRAAASRLIDEDRVVTGDRAEHVGQLRPVDGHGQGLRLAGAGPEHEQLLGLLDAGEIVDQRALQVVPGGIGAGGRGVVVGRRLVGAIGGPLHQPELLDVARQRGLRHVEALGEQALTQLFLAADRDPGRRGR